MIRAFRKGVLALALGAALGVVALLWFFPALRGGACPVCYGLERAAPGLWVEPAMPTAARTALAAEVASARAAIAAFYGPSQAHLRLIACSTTACDRRLGGRGAAAVTYSLGRWSVVRLGPRGLNQTILTHELAHTETHARLGLWGQLTGQMPAWFDEGLSVLISQDARYLLPGEDAAQCRKSPRKNLPTSAFDWAPMAGRERMLYAEAACAVALWLDANGGRAALLTRLETGAAFP